MAVTPTGYPAIARASSIETFGGSVNKKNYLNIGIIDPDIDISAEQFSRMVDIVQATEKTAPFAVLDYGVGEDTIVSYHSQYGDVPTIANLDGFDRITFASSYVDSYGVSAGFTISHCEVVAHGIPGSISAGHVFYASFAIETGQTVTITTLDIISNSFLMDGSVRVTVKVW